MLLKKVIYVMRKILISLLTIVLMTPLALSLGMSDYSFGQAEQGQTVYATIPVYQSALDFNNDFTIEIGGDLAGWLKVTPMNFSLGKGESQILNVTLTVPKDAKLGGYNGTIKAVGHRPVPGADQTGGAVGYTVATLSKIRATVVVPVITPTPTSTQTASVISSVPAFAAILVILAASVLRRRL